MKIIMCIRSLAATSRPTGREVRLVRCFVGRESDVAVDAKDNVLYWPFRNEGVFLRNDRCDLVDERIEIPLGLPER